jgi:hypothetical protein
VKDRTATVQGVNLDDAIKFEKMQLHKEVKKTLLLPTLI